jgi:hypothetical protein
MEQETEQKLREKDDQSTLTITLQKLRQKNLLAVVLKLSLLTGIGIGGRFAFQWLPSVEPIVPLAIAVGFFLGYRYALPSGMGAFYISNFFVWGLQGPWTIFQIAGTGLAALTGDFFRRISKSRYSFFTSVILGTVLYEIAVNFTWVFLFGFFSLELAFLAALPFTLIHIGSSFGFSLFIYGFKDKLSELNKEDILYELKVLAGRRFGGGNSRSGKLRPDSDGWFYRFRCRKLRGSG